MTPMGTIGTAWTSLAAVTLGAIGLPILAPWHAACLRPGPRGRVLAGLVTVRTAPGPPV